MLIKSKLVEYNTCIFSLNYL